MMKHPQTNLVKKGFIGFSWTTFFFGGLPALFRGDILTGVLVLVASMLTFGIAGIIWAFMYNKRYTTGLLEQGYVFADTDANNTMAAAALGVVK